MTAAKLEAVRARRVRRPIINMPPRHLKSHLASVAFPARCLGYSADDPARCAKPDHRRGFRPFG